jgi:hypothetical protein
MKASFAILALACAALLCGCSTNFAPKPLLQKTAVFAYDDFGPERLAAPWLGPRQVGTNVVVHYGQPESRLRAQYPGGDHRFVTVRAAAFHLGRALSALPPQAPESARMRATLGILRSMDRDRRAALNASPPFTGRDALRRRLMTY